MTSATHPHVDKDPLEGFLAVGDGPKSLVNTLRSPATGIGATSAAAIASSTKHFISTTSCDPLVVHIPPCDRWAVYGKIIDAA
jgi:hypothetical protein